MANWLERAKREIPQSGGRATAIAAERNPTAVTAVPDPGGAEILRASKGSNGSAPTAGFQKTETAVPMTASDETAIRRWLRSIGETDPAIIDDVLSRCREDADALAYFVGRAAEVLGATS